jgi:hypothetical protein
VSIDKKVAADLDCDGNADDPTSFADSIEVDKTECVVYKICVTNTGQQVLNTSGVTVSDDHLGIVNFDFGTIGVGDPPVCYLVASQISTPECVFGINENACLCQDVEGTNTATVSSAICEITQVSACIQTGSKCSDNARVNCIGGCRITAGRTNRLGRIEQAAELVCGDYDTCRGQGGGQVGAPCGCSGCFTEGIDPEADLAYEHIQGNWQYDRKDPSRLNSFKIGTFHAKEFNSLICGCDESVANATNCDPDGGEFNDPADFKDGKLCGNRLVGPEPRPAPANEICFSGKGKWTPTNGKKEYTVAFRVEAEDRGEPSQGRNADDTCDVHQIRIWIPACLGGANFGKPCVNDGGCPGSTCENVDALAHASCCRIANGYDTGNVPGIRLPDINDGGNLEHGNIQIHPQTSNTSRGRCPVPNGTCQVGE